MFWPFSNKTTDDILERAAEPLWKVNPPREWPLPPQGKEARVIELGVRAKDKVTGFEGLVVGKCQYLTGCNQALLVPRCKSDGDYVSGQWFDDDRLEVIDSTVLSLKVTTNGADKPAPLY